MNRARTHDLPREACRIIDFDAALLDACDPQTRADLMTEADLLAGAFAPGGGAEALERLAEALLSGERDMELGRAHARRLAAALKRLAKDAAA